MRCKWLNTLSNKFGGWCSKLGTVPAIIKKPDGDVVLVDTPFTLEELVKSLEGTGCTVEYYKKRKVNPNA